MLPHTLLVVWVIPTPPLVHSFKRVASASAVTSPERQSASTSYSSSGTGGTTDHCAFLITILLFRLARIAVTPGCGDAARLRYHAALTTVHAELQRFDSFESTVHSSRNSVCLYLIISFHHSGGKQKKTMTSDLRRNFSG
jgi:hypothetical protein